MSRHWVRLSEVVWEELGGETVLVQPRTERTWLLNSAAAQLWRACDGQARRFDAEGAAFCRQLQRLGLLAPAPATGPAVCFAGLSGPVIRAQGFGTGPRHRPSPRGLSAPG